MAFAVAITSTLTGCPVEVVTLGEDLCEPVECGAAVAVPARVCADGSTGGSTGRCLRAETDPNCHWEVVSCPPAEQCTEADCGTYPTLYVDATGSGVSCLRGSDGVCRWTVDEPVGCQPTDCGELPDGATAYLCLDGTLGGFTGACVLGDDGTCAWEEISCTGLVATSDCTLDECGSALSETRIACSDGSEAGDTQRCTRAEDGTCGWQFDECVPPTVSCGTNADCGDGAYCDRSAVACNAGVYGTCETMPTDCYASPSDEVVCGCDGITYASECEAHRVGVSVAMLGSC